MRAAFLRNLIGLAGTLGLRFLDESHILQQRERGIYDARARRIGAVSHRLDRTDEIVAVTRTALVRDEEQQEHPKFAAFELPAAASTSAGSAAPAIVADVELEGPPAALPPAHAAHGEQSFGDADFKSAAGSAAMMPMSHLILLLM